MGSKMTNPTFAPTKEEFIAALADKIENANDTYFALVRYAVEHIESAMKYGKVSTSTIARCQEMDPGPEPLWQKARREAFEAIDLKREKP